MDNKHKKQNLIKAWWVGVGIALLTGLRHFLALSAADRRRDEAILHPLHIPLLPQVNMKIDIKLRERLQFIACSPPPGKAYGKIAHPKKAGSSNPSPPSSTKRNNYDASKESKTKNTLHIACPIIAFLLCSDFSHFIWCKQYICMYLCMSVCAYLCGSS